MLFDNPTNGSKINAVIVGGGSAGWLTALYLQKCFNISVTVIEDPTVPPIIAGESGSVLLNGLLNKLDISIREWITAVDALPKLGGKMVNWSENRNTFYHGLIFAGYAEKFQTRYQGLGNRFMARFFSSAIAGDHSFNDIFISNSMMENNKVPFIISPDKTDITTISLPMYHFDSRANADFLKNVGIKRGIKLVQQKCIKSNRKDNGDISSLDLENGEKISAEWFFDCSGFARLLIEKELKIKFTDVSNYFPTRNVVAWWDQTELKPYTEVTALKYGWSWNINIQSRSSNGYVYDGDLITVDQAINEAETYFGKKIDPVAKLKFTPSLSETTWNNNVISIGLSSGFLEPLESNGLSQVAMQLILLERLWDPTSNSEILQKMYNQQQYIRMLDILLFLSLHYRGKRTDSEFWLSHLNDKDRIPSLLKDRLDLWADGIVSDNIENDDMFALESWMQVGHGLNLINTENLKSRIKQRPQLAEFYQDNKSFIDPITQRVLGECCTIKDWVEFHQK
jgi:tryptophan halogenase